MISRLRNKIFLMIGRALLTAIKNSEKYMKVQVVALKDETITDMERAQEYGFETYPKIGSEVFFSCIDGNRDLGIAFCIGDRRYRPFTLIEGEVMVYDFNGSYFHLRQDGTFKIKDKNGNYIESTTTLININGNLTVDI